MLAAFVGLRTAAASGLRVADVDFMRGVVAPAVQWPEAELKTETSKTPVPGARRTGPSSWLPPSRLPEPERPGRDRRPAGERRARGC